MTRVDCGRKGELRATTARRGFTILELLVVVAVIALLLGILAPSLRLARRQAARLIGAARQRATTTALGVYALDHEDRYPDSIATIGSEANWNWQEPMMLTGYRARSPRIHRAMSTYLCEYIDDASVLYCPNAPRRYKYLDDVWHAGDGWDNPETGPKQDPASGTYCFYWNYVGYLEIEGRLFRGPARATDSGRLPLISDYLGYDHHRSRQSFSSCEPIPGASVTPGTPLSSAFWTRPAADVISPEPPEVNLNAAYVDGHVDPYTPDEAAAMRVIWKVDTSEPYPPGLGPGRFYLPPGTTR